MNRENPNSIYLPKLLILNFLMSSLWTKIHLFFSFFFFFFPFFNLPLQRIPKGGREISKVCTHWHFAVKLHTQNMHEKLHLDMILIQHSNLFLKEHKKTLHWDSLPGKDSIFLASAWKKCKLSKQSMLQLSVELACTILLFWNPAFKNRCSPQNTPWTIALIA